VIWLIWTVAIVIPFPPFSYLQPIVVGGGAGTWFMMAYLLFLTVAVVGFAAIASIVFEVETHERRLVNSGIMLTGLILLYAGATIGFLLLGFAGAIGGYALIIEHSTVDATRDMLLPFVNLITGACLVAVVGAGFTIYGIGRAKAPKP
jgi:hypothetical protein